MPSSNFSAEYNFSGLASGFDCLEPPAASLDDSSSVDLPEACDTDDYTEEDCSDWFQISYGLKDDIATELLYQTQPHFILPRLESSVILPTDSSRQPFTTSSIAPVFDVLDNASLRSHKNQITPPFQLTEEWLRSIDHYKLHLIFGNCEIIETCWPYEPIIVSQWREQRNMTSHNARNMLYQTPKGGFNSLLGYRDAEGVICFLLVRNWHGVDQQKEQLIAYCSAPSVWYFFKHVHCRLPMGYKLELEQTDGVRRKIEEIETGLNQRFEFVCAMKRGLKAGLFTPGEFGAVVRHEHTMADALQRLSRSFLYAHEHQARAKTMEEEREAAAMRLFEYLKSLCPDTFKQFITKDNVTRAAKYLLSAEIPLPIPQSVSTEASFKTTEMVMVLANNRSDGNTGKVIRPRPCGMLWHRLFILEFCIHHRPETMERPFEKILPEFGANFLHDRIISRLRPEWFDDAWKQSAALAHPRKDTILLQMAENEVTLLAQLAPLVQITESSSKRPAFHMLDARTFDPACADKSATKGTLYPTNFRAVLEYTMKCTPMTQLAGSDRLYISLHKQRFIEECAETASMGKDPHAIQLWRVLAEDFRGSLHNAVVWIIIIHIKWACSLNKLDIAYQLWGHLLALRMSGHV